MNASFVKYRDSSNVKLFKNGFVWLNALENTEPALFTKYFNTKSYTQTVKCTASNYDYISALVLNITPVRVCVGVRAIDYLFFPNIFDLAQF